MAKITILILIIILIFLTYHLVRILYLISISQKLVKNEKSYERRLKNPSSRILLVGNSTGVGLGSESPEKTVAGYFGRDYPNAEIINISKSGMDSRDVLKKLKSEKVEKYDLVLVFTGPLEVLYLKDTKATGVILRQILELSKMRSENVMLISGGKIGEAPFIPWLLKSFYTSRALSMRQEFLKAAKEKGAVYVDIIRMEEDPGNSKFYAADGLHLSALGYLGWYETIKEVMKENGINITP